MEQVVNNLENIITLIQAVSDSGLTSFRYQEGEYSLSMEKKPSGTSEYPEDTPSREGGSASGSSSIQVGSGAENGSVSAAESDQQADYITSPMVGTFYSSKTDGGEPLITVGDTVKAGQTVGIVEAMKLMNEIEAGFAGTVTEILVENGQMVEYGQRLIKVKAN